MMFPRHLVIPLLTAAAIGGAVLAWRQHGELVALRAAKVNGEERTDLKKRAGDLERRNRELQNQLASLRGAAAAPVGTGKPEGKGSSGERREGGRGGPRDPAASVVQQTNAIRELTNRPAVQALLGVQQKAAVEQRYAALFNNLNLPSDQIEKLKTLLAERAATLQDLVAVAREQGINPREKPEAYRKLFAETQGQLNANITATIGENGFAQLTNYEKTLPQRKLVNEFQQRLSYTNTPLTPTQAEQMVQILATNPVQRPAAAFSALGGAGFDVGAMVNGAIKSVPGVGMLLGVVDDAGSGPPSFPVSPAVVSQAQTVLSPPQLVTLQQIQQQQQAQQQLKQLVVETLVANQSQDPTSGSPGTTPVKRPAPPPPEPGKGGGGGG